MGADVLFAEPHHSAPSPGDRHRTQLGARVECWRPKRVNRPAGLLHSPSTPPPHTGPFTLPLAPLLLLCTLSLLPPRRNTLTLNSLYLFAPCIFLAVFHCHFTAACHTLPPRRHALPLNSRLRFACSQNLYLVPSFTPWPRCDARPFPSNAHFPLVSAPRYCPLALLICLICSLVALCIKLRMHSPTVPELSLYLPFSLRLFESR